MAEAELKRLIDHIRRGDTRAALDLLRAEPTLVNRTSPDCFGATPLMHAVNRDDRAMVDLLLDHGADIDQRSDWANGPFGVLDSATDAMAAHLLERGATLTPHAAARLGMIGELRAMLDRDASLVHARGGDGQLPLHFSRTPEIAALLLDRGAAIDAIDIDHASTAAQYLATSRPDVAKFLVECGAMVDPFMMAMIGDIPRLAHAVRAEPQGANLRITRVRFPGPAPAAGHIYLFTIGEGCTLLHAAVNANAADSVRWLLANGADPNARGGYDDQTPLHAAAWRDAADVAPLLIAGGADIDAQSGALHQNQPLGWAIVAGSERMVALLIDSGAKVLPHHVEDAKAGSRGEFQWASSQRSLADRARIETFIVGRASPG